MQNSTSTSTPVAQPSSSTAQKQRQKQKNTLHQVSTIKRSKIANYPYYPVTHTLHQNDLSYVFSLDLVQEASLIITPFRTIQRKSKTDSSSNNNNNNSNNGNNNNDSDKQIVQYNNSYIELQCLPRKNINFLFVLQYDDIANTNNVSKSMSVTLVDFVIGFAAGFLIRVRYTNTPIYSQTVNRRDSANKRELKIVGKFNKKVSHKQGMFAKMSSTFFGSDEFYKVAVQKPIRNFACHNPGNKNKAIKYNYSYLVGNRLYLCTQFTQKLQQQTLALFQQIQWEQMQMETLVKLKNSNATVIKTKRHCTLKMANTLLIEWTNQIPCYIYNANNELIVADNEQNKIIIYNVLDDLRMRSVYSFDLDIKRMSYCLSRTPTGKQQIYLLIMPYDSNMYALNLTNNAVVSIAGHRSYVTQSTLTQSGCIITGGCDHRIGLLPLQLVKEWNKIECVKGWDNPNATKFYDIASSKVVRKKLNEIYFIGEFNNVNEERNNNYGFGFGNFMPMGSQLYAFITFDFFVKVYRVNV